MEDLKVYFTDISQTIIDNAINIKCKSAKAIDVTMDVETVPFNKGFYSVDMTYYFLIKISAHLPNTCVPTIVHGLAIFNKKAILYGSEGNVRTFSSNRKLCGDFSGEGSISQSNTPEAVVQVVEPIILSMKVSENCCCNDSILNIPDCIACLFEGDFNNINPGKSLLITLGVFSIVNLKRDVQVMVPIYDFCVPDKECENNNDDPCDLFKKIKFPVDEFFPPRLADNDDDGSCGSI